MSIQNNTVWPRYKKQGWEGLRKKLGRVSGPAIKIYPEFFKSWPLNPPGYGTGVKLYFKQKIIFSNINWESSKEKIILREK